MIQSSASFDKNKNTECCQNILALITTKSKIAAKNNSCKKKKKKKKKNLNALSDKTNR